MALLPLTVYDFLVIRRFYVNNFRCLENFELPIAGQSSALLIGKNGSGKTTVSFALEILQNIATGTNRVKDLVNADDFTRGRTDVPMRFEIEIELGTRIYGYVIAFEFPEGFKEMRVFEEKLTVDGNPVYIREVAQVRLARSGQDAEARFIIDWHLVALPIIQEPSKKDAISVLKQWLAHMLILRPVPSFITGESKGETLQPEPRVSDLGAWFTGLLALAPSAYTKISDYLQHVMPDFKDIKNPLIGTDSRSLVVQFANEQGSVSFPFNVLSDGEKCFMICAIVLASAREAYGSTFCFWDEPDNHLALDEVGHFVLALRHAFQSGGQFIATSHNPEAIRSFSDENTLYLYRKSHLEPTIVRPLSQLKINGDLVSALARGDVEP